MNASIVFASIGDVFLLKQIGLVVLIAVVLRPIILLLYTILIKPFVDPLRHIPGPQGTYFQTHLHQVMDPDLSYKTHMDWTKRFGQTFRFHGHGRHDYRLMTFDFRSIVHVLSSAAYEKPPQTRYFWQRLIGRGIFAMEGTKHSIQRRIMAPAFTHEAVKNMAPVFFLKAEELCGRWKDIIRPPIKLEDDNFSAHPLGSSRLDVAEWITRASFDVVALGGFNYDLHSLQDGSGELYKAYSDMVTLVDQPLNLTGVLRLYFPILKNIFVDDIAITEKSLETVTRTGRNIVAQRRAEYLEAQEHGMENKDILTLLIKANFSTDPSKQLTDQELLDQCTTFLLPGADKCSAALRWCIHLVSRHPDIQTKLRQETLKVYPSMDDGYRSNAPMGSESEDCIACNRRSLEITEWSRTCSCLKNRLEAIEQLPYLDSVVREALRFCPVVHSTIRVAVRDDHIPVSHPVTLKNGQTVGTGLNGHINIKKGTYVHIPIEGSSYSEDIWGPDALEFIPERWKSIEDWDPSKPGINNLMTFGYGHHSCLGHKWAAIQMKIFLVVLLSAFEFRPVDGVEIVKQSFTHTRPYSKGKEFRGPQLPLVVRELK